MPTHREARDAIAVAAAAQLGRAASVAELEAVQAVASAESRYGGAWAGTAGEGSRNWGAINCTRPEWGCFEHRDTDPQGRPTIAKFQKYPTDVDAAAAVVRNVLLSRYDPDRRVLAAIATGDVEAFSRALYDRGYFTLRFPGQRPEQRIGEHATAIRAQLAAFGAAGLPRSLETAAARPSPSTPTGPRDATAPDAPRGSSGGDGGALIKVAIAAWIATR